jgi:hypothetical protein
VNEHAPFVRLSGAGLTGAPTPQIVSSSSPTRGELRDDAKQHGVRIAD